MLKTLSISILFLMSLTALTGKQSVRQFQWLQGKWKQPNTDRYEEWNIANDSLANGMAYILSDDGEAVPDEIIQIRYRNGQFYYVTIVKKQNAELPVEFKIVSSNSGSLVAENPTHDFPQRIVYKLKKNGSLLAYIEDLQKTKRINFEFERVP